MIRLFSILDNIDNPLINLKQLAMLERFMLLKHETEIYIQLFPTDLYHIDNNKWNITPHSAWDGVQPLGIINISDTDKACEEILKHISKECRNFVYIKPSNTTLDEVYLKILKLKNVELA